MESGPKLLSYPPYIFGSWKGKMDPKDPRHGKLAGYIAHRKLKEKACEACTAASTKYHKERRLKIDKGIPHTQFISATGSRRRVQALMTLGWPLVIILDHAGVVRRSLYHFMDADRINRDDARKIERAYRHLMTREPASMKIDQRQITRAKNKAISSGWAGPMDWNNIEKDPFPIMARPYKKEIA